MDATLKITIGQASSAGRKSVNQDFHGALVPVPALCETKGIAVALADGVSSSALGGQASETAVTAFLSDYYSTPESWSVPHAASRVLQATNSWMHSQTLRGPHRYDRERGLVCTFSGIVFKHATAHLFHVGDARIFRRCGAALERLTEDHRRVESADSSYLTRALGIHRQLDIDHRAVPIEAGDLFVLATDGVHEYLPPKQMLATLDSAGTDLDLAAAQMVERALMAGSPDNLTVMIARIDALPPARLHELGERMRRLPPAPKLTAGQTLDGFELVRELHASSRSRVFLARDPQTGTRLAIKLPATGLQHDPAHIESMLMEEWIARRIDNPHVLKAFDTTRERSCLYIAMQYIEGCTLAQWMRDHPAPTLEQVRDIVGQIARGLQAFHRREMIHQDLRPENLLVDADGTVRIIDFGSTQVAGLDEIQPQTLALRGSLQYAAPEYFLDRHVSSRSDLYSLGVLCYQLLGGSLPYGAALPRARTPAAQRRLGYRSLLGENRTIPNWLDLTVRKAVHLDPFKRYAEVSEFAHALRYPDAEFLRQARPPLIERNPARVWQIVSLILLLVLIVQQLRA